MAAATTLVVDKGATFLPALRDHLKGPLERPDLAKKLSDPFLAFIRDNASHLIGIEDTRQLIVPSRRTTSIFYLVTELAPDDIYHVFEELSKADALAWGPTSLEFPPHETLDEIITL